MMTLFGLSILGKSTPLSGNLAEVSISGPRDPGIRSHVSACADSADTEIDGRFNRKMPLGPMRQADRDAEDAVEPALLDLRHWPSCC
jgi:hypothetical protein